MSLKEQTPIDLNCDMGEGRGVDHRLMPHISSCNIACGGHFGNRKTIQKTVKLARENHVKIGAHPSYPDKGNFGRKPMAMASGDLKKSLKEQIRRVLKITRESGERLHHVKPHGFLYNEIASHEEKARTVVEAVLEIKENLILFVPPHSVVAELAYGKLPIWKEGFADRNYRPDFKLVSRDKPEAVLTKKEQVLTRILSVAEKGKIRAVNGEILTADFDTICLHSDTDNLVGILEFLGAELPKKNIVIA